MGTDTLDTANEQVRDALIRHQIYLLRFSAQVRNYITGILDATEQDIATKIRDKLKNATGLNTPSDVVRMRKLLDQVASIRQGAWSASENWLFDQMKSLAQAEPVFANGIYSDASPVVLDLEMPSATDLEANVTTQLFEGNTIKDWLSQMATSDLRRINAAVSKGMVAGDSSDTIARAVLGTGALGGTDGMTQITRRQVEAITRTIVQGVASSSREDFFNDNYDIFEAELFVATLDSRTTAICRALDGKQFLVGEGPQPPLHFNCRSIRVAAFDGPLLGMRPAKASTRQGALDAYADKNDLDPVQSRDTLPYGTKGAFDAFERQYVRDLTGRVPSSTTYQEWLTSQTAAFQDEVLGQAKGKLFRDGGLTLDKYVTVSGSEMTLSQLAAKYPDAFEKAGLNPANYIKN